MLILKIITYRNKRTRTLIVEKFNTNGEKISIPPFTDNWKNLTINNFEVEYGTWGGNGSGNKIACIDASYDATTGIYTGPDIQYTSNGGQFQIFYCKLYLIE